MNEQRNLFLAIVLMMAVLFGWQYLVAVPRMQEEQAKLADKQKTEMPALTPGVGTPQAAPSVVTRAEALAQSPTRAVIETPTVDGSINLTGARFDDLRLRQYRETPDPRSPEIELLSPIAAEHPYVAEFGWIAAQGETQTLPNAETDVAARRGQHALARQRHRAHLRQRPGTDIHAPHLGRRPLHVHRHRHGEQHQRDAGHAFALWPGDAPQRTAHDLLLGGA